jgi:hypothetical protein
MKYELQLQINFRSAFGELKRQKKIMFHAVPTPQGVENRNILLWFKCVLIALHVQGRSQGGRTRRPPPLKLEKI